MKIPVNLKYTIAELKYQALLHYHYTAVTNSLYGTVATNWPQKFQYLVTAENPIPFHNYSIDLHADTEATASWLYLLLCPFPAIVSI